MKTKKILKTVLLSVFSLFIFSCSKDDSNGTTTPPATGGSREIKYEIKGNFTGKFYVQYSDVILNQNITEEVSSFPWTKTITYPTTIPMVAISAVSIVGGKKGETASMKIYSGGVEKRTSDKTAGDLGGLDFDTRVYDFK